MGNEPTPRNYIRAFFGRWFIAMSGPLSVPLAVTAYRLPMGIAQSTMTYCSKLFIAPLMRLRPEN
jgi:hypothetical protein